MMSPHTSCKSCYVVWLLNLLGNQLFLALSETVAATAVALGWLYEEKFVRYTGAAIFVTPSSPPGHHRMSTPFLPRVPMSGTFTMTTFRQRPPSHTAAETLTPALMLIQLQQSPTSHNLQPATVDPRLNLRLNLNEKPPPSSH